MDVEKLRRAFADKAVVTGASCLTSLGLFALTGAQIDAIGRRVLLAIGIAQGLIWIYYRVRPKRGEKP